MEKISDNAEYLADKAQQKMQQTWNEVSPHIPDAASATASVLAKAFFTLCTVLSIFHLSIIYAFYSHYGCGSLTGTPPADHGRSGGNRMFCQSFHLLHGDIGQKVS